MMNPQMTEFIWSVSLRLPIFLVTFVGIVWAIVSWKKAPTSALFAMLACVVLLLVSIVFPALLAFVPNMLIQDGPPNAMERIRWSVRAILGSWNVCTAICVGTLIFAVFAGRAAARSSQESVRKPPSFDDDDNDRTVDDRIKGP